MTKLWVNPLVEQDKLATYLVGDDQEIVFRKQIRSTNLDLSMSVVDVEVDRAFFRSLHRTILGDQTAQELGRASKEQSNRVKMEDLPIPSPEDDLFFEFQCRLHTIEPLLNTHGYSRVSQEVALIARELMLKELSEQDKADETPLSSQCSHLRKTP